jgi:ATP-dependent Clp protease, protease subunit
MMQIMSLTAGAPRMAAAPKTPATTQVIPSPIRFGRSLLEDPRYVLDFSFPVVEETVAQASVILRKMVLERKMTKDTGSIKLLINSPGGSVTDGFKLLGVIRSLDVPIDTVVMGTAASMGAAMALAAASKGRRFMDRYAKLMIHQPSASKIGGTSEEIADISKHITHTRNIIDGIISQTTGIPIEKIREMTSKDSYIYPLQALKEGFTDYVLIQGDKGLSKDSLKGLTDEQIAHRDQYNIYDDLPQVTFDPMLPKPQGKRMPMGGGDEDEADVIRKLLERRGGGPDGQNDSTSKREPTETVRFKEDLIVAARSPKTLHTPVAGAGSITRTQLYRPRFELNA